MLATHTHTHFSIIVMTFSVLIVSQRNCYYLGSHFAAMRCYILSLTNRITVYVALRTKRPAIITASHAAKYVYLLTAWRYGIVKHGDSKVLWSRGIKMHSKYWRFPTDIKIFTFGTGEMYTEIKYTMTHIIDETESFTWRQPRNSSLCSWNVMCIRLAKLPSLDRLSWYSRATPMLSGSAMFYYVFDAQIFLQPRLVHYTGHILLVINCFFPFTARTNTAILIQLLTKSVCGSSEHIKCIVWGTSKIMYDR
jgi:hypothetical protein